jgi:hypothetical protein
MFFGRCADVAMTPVIKSFVYLPTPSFSRMLAAIFVCLRHTVDIICKDILFFA